MIIYNFLLNKSKMKKLNQLLLLFAMIISISACKNLEKPEPMGTGTNTLTASFTLVSSVNCKCPLEITFNDKSQNATSYEWDFGDNTTKSIEKNPVHCYSQAKTYTVKLKVSDGTKTAESTQNTTISPVSSFEKLYDLPYDYDVAQGVVPVSDGYVLLCTSTGKENNIFLMKVPLDGNWVSSPSTLIPFTDLTDVNGVKIIQTSDKGFLVAGTSNFSGKSDILLIKYDKDLKKIWHKTYDFGSNLETLTDVVETSDSRYLIVGNSGANGIIAKIRPSDGELDLGRIVQFSGISNLRFDAVSLIPNTNLYAVLCADASSFPKKIFIKKFKIDLNENDSNINLVNNISENSCKLMPYNGGFVIAGKETNFGWLTKADGNGIESTTPVKVGSDKIYFASIAQTCDNNIIIAGYEKNEPYAFLTDSNFGLKQYYKPIGTIGGLYYSIVQALDGGYIAVGTANNKILVSKLDQNFKIQ